MDEQTARRYALAHADAVVRGDAAAAEDFAPEAQPEIGALARAMPRPVRTATVESVEVAGDVAVVRIRYAGDDREVTVRSEWSGDERPTIHAVSLE